MIESMPTVPMVGHCGQHRYPRAPHTQSNPTQRALEVDLVGTLGNVA